VLRVALHRIEQRFMPITVLLADDSDLVRSAIRRLLMDHPEISLVGEATDFTETIRMIQELQPQIVILDLHMSDSKRITPGEFRSRLNLGKARLMAISVWNDPETQALAGSYGAANCLDKASLGTHLIPAILHLASPSSESD
jgi:DNA-binding NarL/FixJ family response regulator